LRETSLRLDGRREADGITITVDGRPLACYAGETVATALLAAGFRGLRASPRIGAPRGAFCMMGVCQECAIRIDDRVQQACLVRVHQGLRVELELGV
jgi:predicted molibdopterin-dependent oxidoreductase YjgC